MNETKKEKEEIEEATTPFCPHCKDSSLYPFLNKENKILLNCMKCKRNFTPKKSGIKILVTKQKPYIPRKIQESENN